MRRLKQLLNCPSNIYIYIYRQHHSFARFFNRLLILGFGLLLLFATNSVFAMDAEDACQEASACYWNPKGSDCPDELLPSPVEGDTNEDKIWNYFVAAGIDGVSDNAAAIAGILANIHVETGGTFNPFIGTHHLGLIQWDKTANTSFISELTTTVGDYWGKSDIPADKNDEAIKMELDYLTHDYGAFKTFLNNIDKVDHKTGAEGAKSYSDLFLVTVEGAVETPGNPGTPVNDSRAQSIGNGRRYQAAQARRDQAVEIYGEYSKHVSSSTGLPTTIGAKTVGTGNFSAIMSAKNADKQSTELSKLSFSDFSEPQMKTLLETFGDLAYQTSKAANVPWIAILVQGRYEDGKAECGKNNYWGIGCYPGTKEGGAAVQMSNVGEGFVKYAETVTNGKHSQAVGEKNPITYLEKLGPTWVQGKITGPGYGDIRGMRNSVKALQKYIDTPEGQAIVKTFGNYTGSSASFTDGSDVTWIGDSISVMSESEIKKLLPKVSFHAKSGRTFEQGLEILKKLEKENKLRNIVVFALGSNNGVLKENLVKEVLSVAGNNRKVVFVTNASRSSKSDKPKYPAYDQHNTLFSSLSNGDNVLLADWAGAVANDLEKYLVIDPDGKIDVHPSTEGAKLFAETINKVINSEIQASTSSSDMCMTPAGGGNAPYNSSEIPQYFQGDYPNSPFGSSNVKDAGCGPSSFAMMATVLLGRKIYPDEVAAISGKYYVPGNGSNWEITKFLASHYGLQYKNIGTTCDNAKSVIDQALRDGWMIHTSGGTRNSDRLPFVSAHYIGITSIDESSGQWFIADSANRKNRFNKWYKPEDVVHGINCNNIHAIKK